MELRVELGDEQPPLKLTQRAITPTDCLQSHSDGNDSSTEYYSYSYGRPDQKYNPCSAHLNQLLHDNRRSTCQTTANYEGRLTTEYQATAPATCKFAEDSCDSPTSHQPVSSCLADQNWKYNEISAKVEYIGRLVRSGDKAKALVTYHEVYKDLIKLRNEPLPVKLLQRVILWTERFHITDKLTNLEYKQFCAQLDKLLHDNRIAEHRPTARYDARPIPEHQPSAHYDGRAIPEHQNTARLMPGNQPTARSEGSLIHERQPTASSDCRQTPVHQRTAHATFKVEENSCDTSTSHHVLASPTGDHLSHPLAGCRIRDNDAPSATNVLIGTDQRRLEERDLEVIQCGSVADLKREANSYLFIPELQHMRRLAESGNRKKALVTYHKVYKNVMVLRDEPLSLDLIEELVDWTEYFYRFNELTNQECAPFFTLLNKKRRSTREPTTNSESRRIPEHQPTPIPKGRRISEHQPTPSPEGRRISEHQPTDSPEGRQISEHQPTPSPEGRRIPEHQPTASPEGRRISEHQPTAYSENILVAEHQNTA